MKKSIAHRNIQPTNIKIFNHECPDKITAKLGGLQHCVDLRQNASNNAIKYDHDDRSLKAKSFMAPKCHKPNGVEKVRNKQTDMFALEYYFIKL